MKHYSADQQLRPPAQLFRFLHTILGSPSMNTAQSLGVLADGKAGQQKVLLAFSERPSA